MAKYMGSPWGFLRGKLNDAVGGVWKGIEWTRVRVLPRQRGTLKKLRAMEDGRIRPEVFSWKQFNIRRLAFQLLGWMGRKNIGNLMYPVWQRLCDARKYKLTHINLFVKTSLPDLWDSIPDKGKKYDAATNKPDMNQVLISDGDLEPTSAISSCTYDPLTGVLTVNWDTTVTQNGAATDLVYLMAYVEPVVTASWRPNGYLHGTALTDVATRTDGTGTLNLAIGLTAADVHAYVFFRDADDVIGYSPSLAVTAS